MKMIIVDDFGSPNTIQPSYFIHHHFFLPDLSKAWVLSDNLPTQAQTNTVVVQQKEMDRMRFEPTTSARFLGLLLCI